MAFQGELNSSKLQQPQSPRQYCLYIFKLNNYASQLCLIAHDHHHRRGRCTYWTIEIRQNHWLFVWESTSIGTILDHNWHCIWNLINGCGLWLGICCFPLLSCVERGFNEIFLTHSLLTLFCVGWYFRKDYLQPLANSGWWQMAIQVMTNSWPLFIHWTEIAQCLQNRFSKDPQLFLSLHNKFAFFFKSRSTLNSDDERRR